MDSPAYRDNFNGAAGPALGRTPDIGSCTYEDLTGAGFNLAVDGAGNLVEPDAGGGGGQITVAYSGPFDHSYALVELKVQDPASTMQVQLDGFDDDGFGRFSFTLSYFGAGSGDPSFGGFITDQTGDYFDARFDSLPGFVFGDPYILRFDFDAVAGTSQITVNGSPFVSFTPPFGSFPIQWRLQAGDYTGANSLQITRFEAGEVDATAAPMDATGFQPAHFGVPSVLQAQGFAPAQFGTPRIIQATGFMPVAFGSPSLWRVDGFAPVNFGTPFVPVVQGFQPLAFGVPVLPPQVFRVAALRAVVFGAATLAHMVEGDVAGWQVAQLGRPSALRWAPPTKRRLGRTRAWRATRFGAVSIPHTVQAEVQGFAPLHLGQPFVGFAAPPPRWYGFAYSLRSVRFGRPTL